MSALLQTVCVFVHWIVVVDAIQDSHRQFKRGADEGGGGGGGGGSSGGGGDSQREFGTFRL